MVRPLSEQLADLSVRAKNTEDAWAAAQKEAHDKIAARKAQARAAATAAVEKVNQGVKSAGDSAARDWNTVKAKVAADMKALKMDVAEAKHERDVNRAEERAEQLEWNAGFAIDYAIASVEQAKLAVLDAVDGRLAADRSRSARRRCARHFACASRRIDVPRQQLLGSARYCPGLECKAANLRFAGLQQLE